MAESIEKLLTGFTPDGTGLDRDGLLFAAGKASVRPHRGWRAATGLLAASQLLTLCLLWPAPGKHDLPLAQTPPPPPLPQKTEQARATETGEVWALTQQFLQSGNVDRRPSTTVDDLIPDAPPLHGFVGASRLELD